jgi:hypothetical protein
MTIFLQSVLGLDALHAGFVFVPMSLTSTLRTCPPLWLTSSMISACRYSDMPSCWR